MILNTLTEAVQSGHLPEIREHLAAGADPNVLHVALGTERNLKQNLLQEVYQRMDIEELRHVAQHCDEDMWNYIENCIESSLEAPLIQHDRLKENQHEIVKQLVRAGADVNLTDDQGDTPLHLAVREHASQETLLTLLDAGADVHARNHRNFTPLEQISEMGGWDVRHDNVRVLVEEGGAKIEPKFVAFLASEGHAQTVHLLLDHGFDPITRDEEGRTALHHAVDHPETVRTLLNRGADPTARDNEGTTPIDLARTNGNMDVVTMLGVARREREGQAMRPEPSRTRERSRS